METPETPEDTPEEPGEATEDEYHEPPERPVLEHIGAAIHTDRVRDLGRTEIREPDPEDLVSLAEGILAPTNQIWIILDPGTGREDAQAIADAWNAALVGEIELLDAYQLETPDDTVEQLRARLQEARGLDKVAMAMPNVAMDIDLRIEIERCNPASNPNYHDPFHLCNPAICGVDRPTLTRPYEMIGLREAWTMIAMADVQLHPVTVGVLDSRMWGDSPEMNVTGGPRVLGMRETDLGAEPTGTGLSRVSHATTVTHTLAADHRVGRSIGVASVLGDNLSVIVRSVGADIQDVELVEEEEDGDEEDEGDDEDEEGADEEPGEELDPGEDDPDPTLMHFQDHVFVVRALVELKELVESGASIVNLSLGPPRPAADMDDFERELLETIHDTFSRFVNWTRDHYPEMLFVAAAGNDNLPVARTGEWFGQRQGNVMTIGGLNYRAQRAVFSNYMPSPGDDEDDGLEITLATVAVGIIAHHGRDGRNVMENGNSFAAPQVAGAAAILRGLKPDLSAGQIKQILVDTAATQIRAPDPDDDPVSIPAAVGGRILRVDRAVLHVINLLRQEEGLDPVTAEELMGFRDFVVSADGGTEIYQVYARHTGIIAERMPLGIHVLCGNAEHPDRPYQVLDRDEEINWTVARREDADSGPMVVMVVNHDTDLCYLVTLPAPKSAWDITACDRGIFSFSATLVGTDTRTGVGDPDSPQYITREQEPHEYTISGLGQSPGRGHVEFAKLTWSGLFFEAFDTLQIVPDENTRLEPYTLEGWVRGKVSPELDRVEWLEVGHRHLAKYSRPGKNLEMWYSDVYIEEWMWSAQNILLGRVAQGSYVGPYLPDVPRAEQGAILYDMPLEEQGLVSVYYRTQFIWPYWPAAHHVDQGTSSFTITDNIVQWPGAEVRSDKNYLTVRFDLAEDWWD